MLRRAASNAYSWWWASHVRTKQSKWLDENLQDIEEKVQYALKLLEDEGDSFAKRAEMYYKRRPELISFVEESFKAYRALAERYDHISKELQNANTTIASVFPDQVPEFAMNEDDDSADPSSPRNRKPSKNVPKVPDHFPIKDSEAAAKMFKSRKGSNKGSDALSDVVVNKSGLTKTEAVEEIDKLQKEILVLQTEKEFVKSSYENALAKYWEIENRIVEIQGRVCSLQDEFDEGAVVIEDEEAQVLMSTAALKSCQEKLDEMREKHEENVKETEIARKEISLSKEEIGKHSEAVLDDDGTRTQRNGEVEKEEKEKKPSIEAEDEAFLQKILAHGIEGREKHLLTEYTKVLRNYKEVKKTLDETETRLKSENTQKDEQLRVLNQKLNLLLESKSDGDDKQKSIASKDQQQQQKQHEQLFMLIYREDNAINAIAGQNQTLLSPKEQLFGARVDALLSENLNLLVRFSNSFGQIQQFDTGIKDLHAELLKIVDQKNQDKPSLRSNVRPIYKHLNEIRTELTIWLEKSLLLKEEISSRASTLNNIQNELTEALKTDSEDPETKFTIYQGAKFEGEVSNMQKENNRIAEELQTGLDRVAKLQREADKTLGKLSEEFSLSESKNRSSATRSTQDNKTSIPLRSFIFDVKPKKQRLSLFSCIQPSMSKKMRPDS
ncbi:hypothetical protein Bca101_012169 [Brassica carinata]